MRKETFKSALDKLSISSKEAVVDGNGKELDPFKEYLHVERFAEKMVKDLLVSSANIENPQLILLAGNVGDGKSHLLARLNRDYSDYMNTFEIKNDATESSNINKSWKEELYDFLEDFKDVNLNNSNRLKSSKKIVAINLGILTLFLEEMGDEFAQLVLFVKKEKILDLGSIGYIFNPDSYFQYVNLANFNLFTLKMGNYKSHIIEELLIKLTAKNSKNPFYVLYNEYYRNHSCPDKCCIKNNFDYLSRPQVQKKIVGLLIQVIIKYKLIISIRELLNFFYDLLIPIELSNLTDEELISYSNKISNSELCEKSLVNLLFDSTGTSKILDAISKFDPAKFRDEVIDNYILEIHTEDNVINYFERNKIHLSKNIKAHIGCESNFDKVVDVFLRSKYFIEAEAFNSYNYMFEMYIKYLFYYNNNDSYKLKSLYKNVKKAIYLWNGSIEQSSSSNSIIVPFGKKQLKYRAIQEVKISPKPIKEERKKDQELNEFETLLKLKYQTNDLFCFEVVIDYNLFCLLSKVIYGYRPNQIDRYNHSDFDSFVKQITRRAGVDQDMYFISSNGEVKMEYRLSYEDGFGYEFKKVN